MHVPHEYNKVIKSEEGNVHGRKGFKAEIELSLFDLSADVGETQNVAEKYPGVVKDLLSKIENMRNDLGDGDLTGKGRRECGWQVAED